MNISTAIVVKIIPINRSSAVNPLLPKTLRKRLEESRIILEIIHAHTRANSHIKTREGSRAISNITMVIEDGPAMRGMARGTINGSLSELLPSNIFSELEKTILIAIIKRIIPPAIPRDDCEICNSERI